MGTVSGAGSYVYGEQVDLIAIPKSGYSFFGWYNGDNLISQDSTFSFLMKDYDIHYEARFVKNYKITIINDFEEMGYVESASECGVGLTTSVKAIPNDGYKFVYWCDTDLNVVSDSSQYSFTMPNNDITLYPIFEALPSRLSVINYNDNYVKIIGEGYYSEGENVELFAQFSTGNFMGWYANNELVSLNNPYKFTMPDNDLQLEVRWHNFTISGNCITSCPKDIKFAYIPDSVTSISDYAFSDCRSLTSITIPDSVTSIGDYAFYYCDSLTSIIIPDSVTSIGDYAFSYCSSLTSIIIPDSVTSLGDHAFLDCSSLTSVTIGNSVTSIGNGAFSYCRSLTSVAIGNSVTSIGNYAFHSCSSLTSIIIPDSVTSIGYSAFRYCSSLTSITLPFIGDGTTNNTHFGYIFGANTYSENGKFIPSSLKEVIISDACTLISDYAFSDCRSLTSITIPDSVTSIGDYAFYYCDSLTSIIIPDSVTSIGDYAFSDCSSLTNIDFGGTTDSWRKISFGYSWKPSNLKTITCTDGVITL